MTLDLRQLRFAVTAAETTSFLRAAKRLNVKQSTLSKKVSALEHRLGITLFERSTRGVIPTEAGRAFLEVARRIVTDVDNLHVTAKAVRYGEVGRLIVGFSASLASGNLRVVLGDILERFPDIQLDAVEAGVERMTSGIQSRVLDVAIHASSVEEPDIESRWLWTERLMVILPQSHQLADRDEILWTDLRKCAFVLPLSGTGPTIARVVRQRFASHGLTASIISQETSREAIAAMVPFGRFITIVPESAVGAIRHDVTVKEITEPVGLARLEFSAWWNKGNENPALVQFFKVVEERYPLSAVG